MPLTHTALLALKPALKKYSKPDSLGLHIFVFPNGPMGWRFKYRIHGVPKMISLGVFPHYEVLSSSTKKTQNNMNFKGLDENLGLFHFVASVT